MNKFSLFIPIIFISSLYSCNKPIDYTVNNEEFNNAIKMDNIDCIQANYSFSDNESIYQQLECYPRLVHKIESYPNSYYEYYIDRSLIDTYTMYSREKKDDPLISEISSKENFDLIREEIIQFLDVEVEYKNLKYDDTSKTYVAKVNVNPPNNETATFIYKFENKRIISFKRIVTGLEDTLVTYTYNQETPKIK